MIVQNVKFSQVKNSHLAFPQKSRVPFKGETIYEKNKIYEKDILSLNDSRSLLSNPKSPEQNILGALINRVDSGKIEILSRHKNPIGEIKYNPNAKQPQINFQVGSFQPIIELKDDELGVTVLMTRGSKIRGKNLNIDYKEISQPKISFGKNQFVATTGYMPEKIKGIVDSYMSGGKLFAAPKSKYSRKLNRDYTIVGLGGGYGSRLKPISDLDHDSKPSTKYPGGQKTLFEVAALDTAATAGRIDKYSYINDPADNLSGTAGVVIKGIKNGTIPTDKPLVLLTGDIYNNIDLGKALYAFENDKNCGMALVVKPVSEKDAIGTSFVKLQKDSNINNDGKNSSKTALVEDFSPKYDGSNIRDLSYYRSERIDNNDIFGKYYTSTNIMILSPEVLDILKDYGDRDNKADFVEFLGFMFNVLNKPDESLTKKYPKGLKSPTLNLSSFTNNSGMPRPIYSKNGYLLQMKAITASGMHDREVQWADVGTVEDYISTIRQISSDETNRSNFAHSIRSCVDSNNVIYMDREARGKLDKLKEKYGIDDIEGNVIVQAKEGVKKPETKQFQVISGTGELFELTQDEESAESFMDKLFQNPEKLKQTKDDMIKQYGMQGFLKWYLAPNGYVDNYDNYVQKLFKKANSIEELLKFAPNWAPWKLEEKYWMLNNPNITGSPDDVRKAFYRDNDSKLAQPVTIGQLPSMFESKKDFEKLVSKLKKEGQEYGYIDSNNRSYHVKRLKGGELNDKFIYLIEHEGGKAILKFDRINVEDSETVNGRKLSIFEKRNIRKNKHISPDSIYTNVCISKYLELNGCENIPKALYYDYASNAALFEYVDDKESDLFQRGIIDEERDNIKDANDAVKGLNDLGIYLNDTASKNTLTDKNGIKKVIDLGHSNFIMPFKPGAKGYNFEFANTNGIDIENIYSSLAL